MDKNIIFEISLILLNTIIWLGPLARSIKRGTFSLIHPCAMFPISVIIILYVSLIEHLFGYFSTERIYGLRLTTRNYYLYNPNFFLIPLIIVLISGLAYHYGVKKGCGCATSGEKDLVHLKSFLKTVPERYTIQLFPIAIAFIVICTIPLLLFGQGEGFFWTSSLYYAIIFIPVILYKQNNMAGLIIWLLGLFVIGLRGSKSDYFYYILAMFIFNQLTLLIDKKKMKVIIGWKKITFSRIKLRNLLIILFVIYLGYLGTKQIFIMRDIFDADSSIFLNLLKREYGFEVFSILVYEINPIGQISQGSWILLECLEAIPGFTGIKKIRVGSEVAKIFLPQDYAKLPEAGFNRFFLFAFYHDFGIIGSIFGSWITGFLFAKLYDLALKKVYKKKVLWPLLVYLPFPTYAEMWANGLITYGLAHILSGSIIIWIIAKLSIINLNPA